MSDRLHTLQRIRDIFERRALAAKADAEREKRDAEKVAEMRRDAMNRRSSVIGPVTPLQIKALRVQGIASVEAVQEALQDVTIAERIVEDRTREATKASVERKSVDRLAERRDAEHAIAARAAAQKALDAAALLRRPAR